MSKRYNIKEVTQHMEEFKYGDYVLYSDHLAVIKDIQENLQCAEAGLEQAEKNADYDDEMRKLLETKYAAIVTDQAKTIERLEQEVRDYKQIYKIAYEGNIEFCNKLNSSQAKLDKAIEALSIISENGGENRGMGWTPAQHARVALAELTKDDV